MSKEKRTKPLGTQRIPFGSRGIKDENGNIIRTDHMTMGDIFRKFLDGSPSREEILDEQIRQAVEGTKAMQDEMAGNKRNN